jgi:hypothetical protein
MMTAELVRTEDISFMLTYPAKSQRRRLRPEIETLTQV